MLKRRIRKIVLQLVVMAMLLMQVLPAYAEVLAGEKANVTSYNAAGDVVETVSLNGQSIKLTFDMKGGTGTPLYVISKNGKKVTFTKKVTREGYTFRNWTCNDKKIKAITSKNAAPEMKITANYLENKYTLNFKVPKKLDDVKTAKVSKQKGFYSDEITLPGKDWQYGKYYLKGWTTDKKAADKKSIGSSEIAAEYKAGVAYKYRFGRSKKNEKITLYPVWTEVKPEAGKYSDMEKYWVSWNGIPGDEVTSYNGTIVAKKADVFFITPTVATKGEYADITNAKLRKNFAGAARMELGIYDDVCNVYAPYYAQISLPLYLESEDKKEAGLQKAYTDIEEAFTYFWENRENKENPVVLAGFSQGADMAVRLLKNVFTEKEYQEKLVAVYAIGWGVTDEELAQYPQLKMAQYADDTGVIVSFEVEDASVADAGTIVLPKGMTTNSINPLSWSTEKNVKAGKELNLGACFTDYYGNINKEINQMTGAYISDRGVLVPTDISPADYPSTLKAYFPEGAYHLYDYQFFYRNLEENVAVRVNAKVK